MLVSSAKSKGRSLQKYIVQKILSFFPSLTTNDVSSRSMGAQGVDVLLSESAISKFPYSIEAKCQEALNIWSAIKQTEENTIKGTVPLLVFKRNRSDVYCCLKLEDFLLLNSKFKTLEGVLLRHTSKDSGEQQ
jgi:hypothetical protein